ncbi:cell wall hydrolase [uncultured Sphingomonas sp.]|uniref:cell wall hydrolase n=1 Tax=uncultured Sphingomonas sp. TaxID=158754 RepID=UPI00258BA1EC|nr:cell wall hydrolase [uncultured Sphingomonas sp.]
MAALPPLSRRARKVIGSVLLIVGGAIAVRAGIAAREHRDTPAPPPPVVIGYEADDHFPGAAQLLLDAPVRRGETGTAPLPALPAHADADAIGDASIQPARPFVLRGSQLDRARALQCLTTAIYYEAGNEPDDGQRAVAQVVLNRVRHPAFPATVCGVVFQGSDRPVCQFSFACDGAMARVPAPSVWLRSRRVAARALSGDVFAPVGLATHYHTYAVTPSWNRALVMTGVFGAHFFHRWKGWWGTPAAFTDRYIGMEPMPGPLRPLPPPPTLEAVPVPTVPLVPPTFVAPPTPVASATPAAEPKDTLPPESQVLDRWKDSGKPLR